MYPVSVGLSKPSSKRHFLPLKGLDNRLESVESLFAGTANLVLYPLHFIGVLRYQVRDHLTLSTEVRVMVLNVCRNFAFNFLGVQSKSHSGNCLFYLSN